MRENCLSMSDHTKARAPFAPWDRRELPGIFTVEDSARRVGNYKWAEMRLFEVLGCVPLTGDALALSRLFEAGLAAYRAGDWAHALELFQGALEIAPGDGPSQLYRRRCQAFIAAPPAPDWDGVYTIESA